MLTLLAIAVTALVVFGLFVWLQDRREAGRTDNTLLIETNHAYRVDTHTING